MPKMSTKEAKRRMELRELLDKLRRVAPGAAMKLGLMGAQPTHPDVLEYIRTKTRVPWSQFTKAEMTDYPEGTITKERMKIDPMTFALIPRLEFAKRLMRVPKRLRSGGQGMGESTLPMNFPGKEVTVGTKGFRKIPKPARRRVMDVLQEYPQETLDMVKEFQYATAFGAAGDWTSGHGRLRMNPEMLEFEGAPSKRKHMGRTLPHELGHAFEDWLGEEGTGIARKAPKATQEEFEKVGDAGIFNYDRSISWKNRPPEQFSQAQELVSLLKKLPKGATSEDLRRSMEWQYDSPPSAEMVGIAKDMMKMSQRASKEVPGTTRFHSWLKGKYPSIHKGFFRNKMLWKKGEITAKRILQWNTAYESARREWEASLPRKLPQKEPEVSQRAKDILRTWTKEGKGPRPWTPQSERLRKSYDKGKL